MRYLTIYIDTHRLFCVDLSKPNRQEVRKAVAYVYLYPDGHPNSPVYGHLKLPHLN